MTIYSSEKIWNWNYKPFRENGKKIYVTSYRKKTTDIPKLKLKKKKKKSMNEINKCIQTECLTLSFHFSVKHHL